MIIDTHTHLDNEKYYNDIDEVIKRAKENGVEKFIIPAADPKDIKKAVELAEKYEEIYFAVGVHPINIREFDYPYLLNYINHPKCVAIGECGLDYYRLPEDDNEKKANIALQKKIFIEQIEFAKKYNKPLIIHIRDASQDSKKILIDHEAKDVGGVLHCFNADENLLELSDHNFYFGIGGVVTFKNAKKLVNVLPKIPQDKIIVETDGPYLTPHPHRGTRNEPRYTKLVVEKIAQILDVDSKNIEKLTTQNAKKLFKELNTIN